MLTTLLTKPLQAATVPPPLRVSLVMYPSKGIQGAKPSYLYYVRILGLGLSMAI